jgi:hypothetical protein
MDAEPVTAQTGLIARLRAKLTGGTSEASVTRRLGGTIFAIRCGAGLAYLSQILLARWMGGSGWHLYPCSTRAAARQHDGLRHFRFRAKIIGIPH